jgi:hypothetical protein
LWGVVYDNLVLLQLAAVEGKTDHALVR